VRLRIALAVAALSGFIALSYEIVWYRVLSVMTGGVASSFGLLLAVYLFGLATGSRLSAVCCRREGGSSADLRVLASFVVLTTCVAATVVPVFAWSASFTDYRVGLAMVALAAGLLGAVFPLVSHFGIEPDEHAGARLSYVYLANILGSATGSLITGFVLMERLPLSGIAGVLVASGLLLAAGLLLTSRCRGTSLLAAYGGLAGAGAIAWIVVPRVYDRLYERLIYKHEDHGERFVQIVENRAGVITVATDGTVYGGGAYDGVLNTRLQNNDRNGILRAYVIGGLHPAPRDVLVIGLSSGSWAQVVANLPGTDRVTIVEINPGYVDVVARHPETASLLRHPKVSLVFDDGRRWLLRNPERRFDFVLMNTTMHWRAHATNLLSTEFLAIVREHLSPGGVLYFNTTDSYDVQLTAARAFPHMMRITNFVAVSDNPFAFDRARFRRVLETMTIDERPVLDLRIASDKEIFDDLLGFNDMEFRASILERYEKTRRIVTEDNMVVEWDEPLRYAGRR
jgi:spermidine synthase